MPNWCNNTIEIIGAKEKINQFVSFLEENNGKDWFNHFLPCPQELLSVGDVSLTEPGDQILKEKYGHSDWYSWCIENWGCKWNCDAQDWMKVENTNADEASVTFWFDSPWGPPIQLYESIEANSELTVIASYHEEGMAFVGKYSEGFDEIYEYSDLESLDDIPEELVEEWNLVELLQDREEWEDE